MKPEDTIDVELAALASHLHSRRDAILTAWSRMIRLDPDVTTAGTLSRVQFYDHMPAMLDALERTLRATHARDTLQAQSDETDNAEDHGLQRWQQGYADREVMREWIALNECVADELEHYTQAHPTIAPAALCEAWRRVSEFSVSGMSESVAQYERMQRSEAAARVSALEAAAAQLGELERQRAEAWREATHDLRGNVSIVENVANVLRMQGPSEKWLPILGRGVASLIALLDDLTTQARLDAGHETRDVRPFDAAAALAELCANLESLAVNRDLFLKCEGPPHLEVQGDRVKVCRIAQNLVLNALQYTKDGGVKVTWEEIPGTMRRWSMCVQDTGPGLSDDAAPGLSVALDAATREGQAIEREGAMRGDPTADPTPAPTLASRSEGQAGFKAGEGIGLSIVKRLCELLDASIELHTQPGAGTTFRVTFPAHYPKG